MPDRVLIVCADNDQWTEVNPGFTKATAAAREAKALFAIPSFQDTTTKPTDFNDLHRLEGLDAVRRCIDAAAEPLPKIDIPTEWPDPIPFDDYSSLPISLLSFPRARPQNGQGCFRNKSSRSWNASINISICLVGLCGKKGGCYPGKP